MKKTTVSVINDLVTDQRVNKVCLTLKQLGFEVLIVGRRLSNSPMINERPYNYHRMKLLFTKGPFFYAFFNIRLFFFLLFNKTDVLVSNDLDTLLANFLISKIKRKPLVYDSHEYFTEVPELNGRVAKKIWLIIEKKIFPKLKDVFTVNNSIAEIYKEKYGINVKVVRNLPMKYQHKISSMKREEIGISADKKIIILQGSGINLHRGGEEAVMAMEMVEDAVLLIVGGGDALHNLKEIAAADSLKNKVMFIPRQSPQKLYEYTSLADIGLSLDRDTNLNYRFSLPNKIFDYIQCGVPVLATDLPEVSKIVKGYDVGLVMENFSVKEIADSMNIMLKQDFKKLKKDQIWQASQELCWENEVDELKIVYSKFLN